MYFRENQHQETRSFPCVFQMKFFKMWHQDVLVIVYFDRLNRISRLHSNAKYPKCNTNYFSVIIPYIIHFGLPYEKNEFTEQYYNHKQADAH